MTPKPRFLYFDLDDTLLDHRRAERHALDDVCRQFEHALGAFEPLHVQETYHVHNVELWRRYALGEIGKEDLKRLRFEQLLQALAIEELDVDEVNEHYFACYARHWCYMEGAREAYLRLADRYRTGVLTNGFAEIQRAKLDRFPELRDRIEILVISEEVGRMKPDLVIFHHAAERAGCAPEEILYVGDSFGSDVQGALGAGWRVAWFRGTPERVADDERVFCFDDWDALDF